MVGSYLLHKCDVRFDVSSRKAICISGWSTADLDFELLDQVGYLGVNSLGRTTRTSQINPTKTKGILVAVMGGQGLGCWTCPRPSKLRRSNKSLRALSDLPESCFLVGGYRSSLELLKNLATLSNLLHDGNAVSMFVANSAPTDASITLLVSKPTL